MASVSLFGIAGRSRYSPFQLVSNGRSHSQSPLKLTTDLLPQSTGFRPKYALRLQMGQRRFAVYASNSNPSGGDSIEEKPSENETSEDAQGPPILTILAGVLVFFFLLWIIGSVAMWLISLIFSLSQ